MSSSEKRFSIDALTCLTDLHLHLDGAISPRSARVLAQMQGIELPENDSELLPLLSLSENCSDLEEFLSVFAFPCSLLKSKDAIRCAMETLLQELKSQGVMYAEIRFAPQILTSQTLTQEQAVLAAIDGMRSGAIPANLILCCMRESGLSEQNWETAELAAKYFGKGVAALDLAGSEAAFPIEGFRDIFSFACEKGIPFTIHAGEAVGAQNVWAALSLGASRIGHGIRSGEDKTLLAELANRSIPLEMCPTSNLMTASVPSLSKWPLRTYLDAGIMVTINTDDPAIERTDIKCEFRLLADVFALSKDEIRQLLVNSVRASFADDALKQTLLQKIDDDFAAV